MTRRQARENAFIAAFESTFHPGDIADIIAYSQETDYAVDTFGQALLFRYEEHSYEVDALIESKLKDWTLARLPRVNATVLRLAVTEMVYGDTEEDMDSIVINEAVEIAKKYADEADYQFINGVLGSVSRDKTPDTEA